MIDLLLGPCFGLLTNFYIMCSQSYPQVLWTSSGVFYLQEAIFRSRLYAIKIVVSVWPHFHKSVAKIMTADIYQFSGLDIQGNERSLEDFKGQVVLIVNTASKCGFTPQFKDLEELYEKYKDKGLMVLGFPCNRFMNQDPGSNEEIGEFCQLNYGVTFPMFQKIEVNGDNAHPLFQHLKSQAPGMLGSEAIKWNFTKFLVNKNGEVVARFAPKDTPAKIESKIVKLLS